MNAEREGLIGKANPPHGHEPTSTQAETVPDEENVDEAKVEADLEQEPEEKHNATDGYAPADDPSWDDEQLED